MSSSASTFDNQLGDTAVIAEMDREWSNGEVRRRRRHPIIYVDSDSEGENAPSEAEQQQQPQQPSRSTRKYQRFGKISDLVHDQ